MPFGGDVYTGYSRFAPELQKESMNGGAKYWEEVDFSVVDPSGNLLDGGIDSTYTGEYTYRGIAEQARQLHRAFPGSIVTVTDRRDGRMVYERGQGRR